MHAIESKHKILMLRLAYLHKFNRLQVKTASDLMPKVAPLNQERVCIWDSPCTMQAGEFSMASYQVVSVSYVTLVCLTSINK